ncbi:hypothetical protein Pint_18184 [Pistacia integerrima]|uniref:Uncharacterized protein n=1 Tax=Pistacia integerrima TaxID=434235 RepID=A0ACC0YV15_9ROSI|nr:hypothetical protein Pint_18184 [Pistacia integerrima]
MGRLLEGKQVHGLIVKFGFVYDEFIVSNLVRMFVMCGEIDDAHILFYKNIVEFGNGSKLVGDKRRQEGNVVLWNVMIDWFVRIGNFRASRDLFDKMPQRSVVSWNAMISGYAQSGKFREAIEMFHEMQMGDVRQNYVTLVSVLPPISRLGALELGKWVHLYAKEWVEEKKRQQNAGLNLLSGPLSPSVSNLTAIKYLNFGINTLSGQLPKELGTLPELIVL